MFGFIRRKKKSLEEVKIETSINDMKLYLENNYKDLAISSRKEAIRLLEDFYQAEKISHKTYEEYKQILDSYTKEMAHYNHQEFYHS